MNIKVKKLTENAVIPTYGTPFAAGADLYACMEGPVAINPGETYVVHTGIALEIPDGHAGFIFARSGLATKHGLTPANKVGVVDSDYRGEIMVSIFNHSDEPETIAPGDRIAQMVIMPYVKAEWNICDDINETARGTGGFGSTGK